MLSLAKKAGLPILVHMNDGRWADCCTPNSSGGWGDALLDVIAQSPDTTVRNSKGESLYQHNSGGNYFVSWASFQVTRKGMYHPNSFVRDHKLYSTHQNKICRKRPRLIFSSFYLGLEP
jgi:hypothetical protein